MDAPSGAVLACFALGAVFSYFCGCLNGAVIVSKYILRDDVRNHGSGNAGLTNFFRTFGGPFTLVVLLFDVLKALLAVGLTMMAVAMFDLAYVPLAKYWSGLFCLLGHMFPCMFHFKGGKGILSGGTVALLIDWRVALVVWGGFFLLTVLTRYVSLGSCWAGTSFPVVSWFVYRDWYIGLLAALTGALILYQHRGNIRRLLNGTERKLSFHHTNGGT